MVDGPIYTIHIVLTNYCNQGCIGCYQTNLQDTKSILLLTDHIKQEIISQFIKARNLNYSIKLSFFGGEPLTRANTIFQILTFLTNSNLIPNIVHIPTSGGKNQNLIKNERLRDILNLKYKQEWKSTKFVISQSYDGPNNITTRNTSPTHIKESIMYILNINDQEDFRPDYTSCLIPETISEDYFIVTQQDVLETTGRLPNFRIPHLISKDSNIIRILPRALNKYFDTILNTNFVTEHSPMYRAKNLIKMAKARVLPKLFNDFIIQIIEPKEQKYLWCGAGGISGINQYHQAITKDGIHPNGCEYLNEKASILQDRIQEKCSWCEIQKFCHRPCLKNAEDSLIDTNLEVQCTIRKIIFREIKNIIMELSPNPN